MLTSCPFSLETKKDIIEFGEKDPFNTQNILKGIIYRKQGPLYGTVYITHVNGKKMPQIVYSAPKMHYPFEEYDVETKQFRNFKIPEADTVELYTKLDGTAIISYTYTDGKENFLTYKTRLSPFLHASKFGNYYGMWKEILEMYPQINKECKDINHNHVFELYGKRNRVLVDYDVPLDTRLLFSIDANNNSIIPPSRVPNISPKLEPLETISINDISEKQYLKYQQDLSDNLTVDEENEIIKGDEGAVWYFIKDNKVSQIKCKPDEILKYHWAPEAIPKSAVYTTCFNAFENFEEPSIKDVMQLLEEEFTIDKIEKSRRRIEVALIKAKDNKRLQYEVSQIYDKYGMDINKNKAKVMQEVCKRLPNERASRIYTLLNAYVKGVM